MSPIHTTTRTGNSITGNEKTFESFDWESYIHDNDDNDDDHDDFRQQPILFTNQVHSITYTSRHCCCHRHSIPQDGHSRYKTTVRMNYYYYYYRLTSVVRPIYDLIYNDLLIYLLPTHPRTHYIKNIFIIILLLLLLGITSYNKPTTTNYLILFIFLGILLWWLYYNRRILYYLFLQQSFPHYMNPYITSEHRLPMRSIVVRYINHELSARRMACRIVPVPHDTTTSTSTAAVGGSGSDDTTTTSTTTGTSSIHMNNIFCLDSIPVTPSTATGTSSTTTTETETSIIHPTSVVSNNNIRWKFRLYNTVQEAFDDLHTNLFVTTPTTTTTTTATTTKLAPVVLSSTSIKYDGLLPHNSNNNNNKDHHVDKNNKNSSNSQTTTTLSDPDHHHHHDYSEDHDDWITDMVIPSNWTLHPRVAVKDPPRYTNIKYPFPNCEPPLVPPSSSSSSSVHNHHHNTNPTATYCCTFTLPMEWFPSNEHATTNTTTTTTNSNKNDIEDMDDITNDEYTIVVHGIESAYYIYYNHQYIGFAKDSRLCSEFPIPRQLIQTTSSSNGRSSSSCCSSSDDHCHKSTSTIHIVVVKWCDGTYVEDQDHWYLSGIHRSIEVVRRPCNADIIDFKTQADANGHFECCVEYRKRNNNGCSNSTGNRIGRRVLIARIYNDQQLSGDGTLWKAGQCIWEAEQSLLCDDTVKSSPDTTTARITFVDTIQSIQTWSAEIPNLYTLTVSLYYEVGDDDSEEKKLVCTQSEFCRIGFRTINIVTPGIVYINNQRIKNFAGMNRHEHDPDTGKVVTVQRMIQDICLLKQNNFNLVRTSHYPNHQSFYKLTDYYGLYVWDEANIEVHGMKPMGRLAHDSGWRATFLSRITRMVHRDRNHPSIIFWSMGNEAGRGRNFQEARDILKILDPSRPVVYESGGAVAEGTGRTELTDIISTMYPILPRTKHLASRPDEDRPVILCEYSHSMGNSNGNLHYYWDAFWDDNLPRLQGGCIWDMIDQGIRVPGSKANANPSPYFAYGGDFNDTIHDAQFCINGMFSPDREPHPAVHEIKYLQQPVHISPRMSTSNDLIEGTKGAVIVLNVAAIKANVSITFHALNRYTFCDLSHLVWTWELTSNRSTEMIRAGRFDVPNCGGLFEICLNEVITRVRSLERANLESLRENTYWLNMLGCLKETYCWADAGHVVAREQFRIAFNFEELLSPIKRKPKFTAPTFLEAIVDEKNIEIIQTKKIDDKRHTLAKIDKQTGSLVQYAPNDRNLFCTDEGLVPNYVRAATDNDKGGMELALNFMTVPSWVQTIWYTIYGYHDCSYASIWRSVGLDGHLPPRIVCERIRVNDQSNTEKVDIVALCTVLAPTIDIALMKIKFNYVFYSDGRVQISNHVNPLRSLQSASSLPRIGMRMVLDASLCNIQYCGRGPYENYPDRKVSAKFGVYNTTPNEMSYYGYIVPSENGSRSDCEYAAFCTKDGGNGLCIVSRTPASSNKLSPDNTFSFSASHHSIHELHAAKHTCDLVDREAGVHPIHVNIDHALMGLGGDTSWFPGVYDEFLVKPQREYQYTVWLLPISKSDDISSVAWTVQ